MVESLVCALGCQSNHGCSRANRDHNRVQASSFQYREGSANGKPMTSWWIEESVCAGLVSCPPNLFSLNISTFREVSRIRPSAFDLPYYSWCCVQLQINLV